MSVPQGGFIGFSQGNNDVILDYQPSLILIFMGGEDTGDDHTSRTSVGFINLDSSGNITSQGSLATYNAHFTGGGLANLGNPLFSSYCAQVLRSDGTYLVKASATNFNTSTNTLTVNANPGNSGYSGIVVTFP